jgi:hypothetical protein
MSNDILIIPDAHAHADFDNSRFSRLGSYINSDPPSHVVCIGDWADLPSICTHSKKIELETKRYIKDVDAAIDAQEKMFSKISSSHRNNIRFTMCLGNHEHRINKLASDFPHLANVISVGDLKFTDYGWKVVPFQELLILQGFHFTHHFPSGIMGRPVSGDTPSKTIVKKRHVSCVQGHSHILNHYTETDGAANGRRLHGLTVGCYTHPRFIEGWNTATFGMWWNGLVRLKNPKNGDASIEFIRAVDL